MLFDDDDVAMDDAFGDELDDDEMGIMNDDDFGAGSDEDSDVDDPDNPKEHKVLFLTKTA